MSGSRTTTTPAQLLLARTLQPLAGVACAALVFGLASCTSASSPTSATSARPAGSAAATASPSTRATPSASAKAGTSSKTPAATPTPVPSRSVVTRPPVPLHSAAAFGDRVEVSVIRTASVVSKGSGPGEIAGAPSVAVTLRLANSTARTVRLGSVIVNATYGRDATPASPVDGRPARPFSGSVRPGHSATGVYVFAIPKNARGAVAFSVSYRPGGPVVVLRGTVR